jgi:hypothetical protein
MFLKLRRLMMLVGLVQAGRAMWARRNASRRSAPL